MGERIVSGENPKSISTDFLAPILNKPLTVERIDNYANDVIDELISLVNSKVEDFQNSHNTGGWDDKAIEDAALKFYELESIGDYLDFLAKKDEEIQGMDRVIKNANQVWEVIVRPDSYNPNIVGGNGGEMKENKIISRVKTVLFILKEDFEVDVTDKNHLILNKGILRDNMMRKASYFLISVPKIDRTLLVCDEENNASYVFNSKVLKDRGITEDILINLTKDKLNELIQQTPELGKRVVYSKDGFVPRMIISIQNPINNIPDENTEDMKEMGKYLFPKVPDGYQSMYSIAKKYGVDRETVETVVGEISNQLGAATRYKFRSIIALGFSPAQQEIIRTCLEKRGFFSQLAPEGYCPLDVFSHMCGLDFNLLKTIIESNKDEIGLINTYRFKNIPRKGYSPRQQEIILKILETKGYLSKPPEGYLTRLSFSKKNNLTKQMVSKITNEIREDLGEIKKYKSKSIVTEHYSPKQQEIILGKIRESGYSSVRIPDGYLPIVALSKKISIGVPLLRKIIETINSHNPNGFGSVNTYRVGTQYNVFCYSPKQQEMINEYRKSMKKG